MHATFCPTCGETRWQLSGITVQRENACALCGGELITERRLPGRKASATAGPHDERRVGAYVAGDEPAAPAAS